jgi:hypothetical protein
MLRMAKGRKAEARKREEERKCKKGWVQHG